MTEMRRRYEVMCAKCKLMTQAGRFDVFSCEGSPNVVIIQNDEHYGSLTDGFLVTNRYGLTDDERRQLLVVRALFRQEG